ncbi:MAG: M20/M25/M40 family metallo-hydrolase, partial [Planctomycetota bacterium]
MNLELNQDRFLRVLTDLIGQSKHLQNNPPKFIPEEDRAGNLVLEALRPHTEENGGPLKMRHIAYKPGRGNILIEYPGTTESTVSLVGSHLDVVPADPAGWEHDPFSLTVEGDKLHGRGVTDCLGHVALLVDLFTQLAESKPELSVSVIGVLIANEENSEEVGIGIDELVKQEELARCKNGPVYWLDSADIHPTIGTGGMAPWQITVRGKLFHSGMPDKAVNALELGMEVVRHIQDRFYDDFPPHPDESRYLFVTGSSLKPTQWSTPEGSINQIPGECTIAGDIRLTPFYRIEDVQQAVQRYV